MCALWHFWRKDRQDQTSEDPGPLLPKEKSIKESGEKSIGESGEDVTDYLAKNLSGEGRLKGVRHPDSYPRDYKLGPGGDDTQPKPKGPGLDAAMRERMRMLLSDATGKPADTLTAGTSDDEFSAAVDAVFRGLAGAMSLKEFNSRLTRAEEARMRKLTWERDIRGLHAAADWLALKARDNDFK